MLALLFFFQPQAVSITGLGTFHIQKWLSSENGEVLAFQRPVFSLSRTVARIRELHQAACPRACLMEKAHLLDFLGGTSER